MYIEYKDNQPPLMEAPHTNIMKKISSTGKKKNEELYMLYEHA